MDQEKISALAADLDRARQDKTKKPVSALDLNDGYEVLKNYVEYRGQISGYKGAITNEAAQQPFGAAEPLAGVLFEDACLTAGSTFQLADFHVPVVETELGFVLRTDISEPQSEEDFLQCLGHWLPMIEVGDVGFAGRPTLGDLAAGNSAAAYYILSDYQHPISSANDVSVTFSCADEVIHVAQSRDVMGDQLLMAKWLVDKALNLGLPVKAGMVLMTGSMGAPAVAKAGHYLADYGEFGQVAFDFV